MMKCSIKGRAYFEPGHTGKANTSLFLDLYTCDTQLFLLYAWQNSSVFSGDQSPVFFTWKNTNTFTNDISKLRYGTIFMNHILNCSLLNSTVYYNHMK